MRHLACRTLRLLLSFAVAEGHIERNPARGLRIKGLHPREVYWQDNELNTFIKAAQRAGRPSLGLAAKLGRSRAARG
jgi:hypothetical protein